MWFRVVCVAVVATMMMPPASAVAPGDNGRLAWVTGCCDQYELWATEADLSTLRQLTHPRGFEFVRDASWSPAGRIVFSARPFNSDVGDSNDLWTINGDGTLVIRVTATPGWESDPDWSPDGSRIAFMRKGDLFTIKATGYGRHRLTETQRFEWSPVWSPDGTTLAFLGDTRLGTDLFLLDVTTGSQTRLTRTRPDEFYPEWLPDGTGLVFTRAAKVERGIWTMDLASRTMVPLLDEPGIDENAPAVAPDGTRIAWVRVSPHPDPVLYQLSELTVSDLDGGNAVVLDTCVLECSFHDLDWETV